MKSFDDLTEQEVKTSTGIAVCVVPVELGNISAARWFSRREF